MKKEIKSKPKIKPKLKKDIAVKKKKGDKLKESKVKSFFLNRKFILIIIGVILLLTILLFATKAYLYFRFLIGNGFVVTLNSEKTNFFLQHNEQDNVVLTSQVFSNAFCTSKCSSTFVNLGSGEILEKKEFNLKPTITNIQEYNITADKIGNGQDLYRFEIKCEAIKSTFCETSDEVKTRSVLITLDYDLNADEKIKQKEFGEIISLGIENISYLDFNFLELNNSFLNLMENNNAIDLSEEIENLSNSISLINQTYMDLEELWINYDYASIGEIINASEDSLKEVKENLNDFNETVYNLVLENNYLFDNLSYAKQKLNEFKLLNVSFNDTLQIDLLIDEFNSIVENKDNYSLIYSFVSSLDLNFTTPDCCFASGNIANFNFSKIYLNYSIEIPTKSLFESPPECCFLDNCDACCDDCATNESLYPIVFVHGHSFNHKVSAEYSFDTFDVMQNELEKEGYIGSGTIISTSVDSGFLSRANYPFTFRASYYFEIYKNYKSTKIIDTKQDSIDSYAIRLNDIIKEIKFETGKDKVIIICHSMGGLVSRRYLQIFGEEDVSKLIILGTPNYGISKKIYNYCKLFGADQECDDMNSDSLLISKLNQAVLNIPVYNIIGLGCDMDGQDGDGIVENSTAYLDFANNYYINGTCPGTIKFLHLDMVYPDKYPEVYEIIKSALRE